jgi:hypothetical protein
MKILLLRFQEHISNQLKNIDSMRIYQIFSQILVLHLTQVIRSASASPPLRGFSPSEHLGASTQMGFGPGWPFTPPRITSRYTLGSLIITRNRKTNGDMDYTSASSRETIEKP